MADAPFGRGPSAASNLQEPCGSGWSFWLEAVGRLRVDQLVFMAVRSARRAVSSLSNVVWSLIGCPSSKGDRSMLSPAGKFQGAKSGRSGARWYERQEAPIAPGIAWPPVCNPASRPDTSMLPIMWGGNNHPARARVGSSPRDGGGRARGTNTLRLLSKCCGRRLPVRLAFIFRDAVQVRNQPKRCFPFVPRRLNGQAPGVYLLGRGVETRATPAGRRAVVGLNKGWIVQVRRYLSSAGRVSCRHRIAPARIG